VLYCVWRVGYAVDIEEAIIRIIRQGAQNQSLIAQKSAYPLGVIGFCADVGNAADVIGAGEASANLGGRAALLMTAIADAFYVSVVSNRGLLSSFLGGSPCMSALRFWWRYRRCGEPHQSCKPQSVPICPQQHIPVLGSFLQPALLNFSPRLIDFVG
jgi:hypothetical protein